VKLREQWKSNPIEFLKVAASISQIVAGTAMTAFTLGVTAYMTKKEFDYIRKFENKSNPIVPMGARLQTPVRAKWYKLYWK
jgi:ABC-type uncharacterized transport system permease subunit